MRDDVPVREEKYGLTDSNLHAGLVQLDGARPCYETRTEEEDFPKVGTSVSG